MRFIKLKTNQEVSECLILHLSKNKIRKNILNTNDSNLRISGVNSFQFNMDTLKRL